jgi:cell wall assembly regulator SMI1
MTDAEDRTSLVARWKQIVIARHPAQAAHWGDDPFSHFLHDFRPDGAGLEPLFEGMPQGEAVLRRLRQVLAAGTEGQGDAYVVARKPPLGTAADIEALAREHLSKIADMCRALGPEGFGHHTPRDLHALLDPDRRVQVLVQPFAPTGERGANAPGIQSLLYEIVTEFGSSAAQSLHADLLADPLYHLACSYELAYYILWPHLAEERNVLAPFDAYFELWRHGASLCFEDADAGWSFDRDGIFRVHVARVRDGGKRPPRAASPEGGKVKSPRAALNVAAAWKRIENRLQANAPEILAQLNPPAPEDELADAEKTLGRPLPQALRASLRRHDGTSPEMGLLGGRELLSVAQIVALQGDDRVAPTWFPIAEGDASLDAPEILCLDARGAVVLVRDEEAPVRQAASYGEWLGRLADDLEAGRLTFDGAWLVPAGAAPELAQPRDEFTRFAEHLVSDKVVELAPGATADALVAVVKLAFRGKSDVERGRLLSELLLEHDAVEELFADEVVLTELIAREL